jgi:hypothetical protein
MDAEERVPAKSDGLHVEREGEELRVFNPRDETTHRLDGVSAAVFEACNGVRSVRDAVQAVADWVNSDVEGEVVDRTIIDLTKADLVIHLDG